MIKVKVNGPKGICKTTVKGKRLDLLAELPLIFGKLLHVIMKDTPAELKNDLIKYIFELTLEELKEYEEALLK